jgi:hypothetical protein
MGLLLLLPVCYWDCMCECRLVMSVVWLVITTSGRSGYRSEFNMQWILTLAPWGYEA